MVIISFLITSDNARIYYQIKGQGKPIVFIHGFSEDHDSFRIQQRILSKKYKIVTYDLRGHGTSDRVDFGLSLERFALDLKELIDKLDLKDVVLVGWSMGGSVIFEYVKEFSTDNICKICIVDMGPKSLNDNEWKLGLLHGEYGARDHEEDLTLIKENWMAFADKFIKSISPVFNELQIHMGLKKMKKNSPHVMYSMWESIGESDYRGILQKITIPSLIVFGEKSTFYSLETGEYLRDNIIDSKLIVFEDCTHLLVLENPMRFNRVLEDFILE